MKIIALYSIKGGVGKTATAVNLAYVAARDGAPTILCDLDPQGSASYYFRVRPPKKLGTRRLIKGGAKLEKGIRATDYEGLDLLPSTMSYRNLDLALSEARRSKRRLGRSLRSLEEDYEYMILDCPPNITLVSENVFRAADLVLLPLVPTTLSQLTYRKLVGFFRDEGLDERRILPFFSMVESRKRLHRDVMDETANSGIRVLGTPIPYVAEVESMGVHRAPVVSTRPTSKAAVSYIDLWHEVRDVLSGRRANEPGNGGQQ